MFHSLGCITENRMLFSSHQKSHPFRSENQLIQLSLYPFAWRWWAEYSVNPKHCAVITSRTEFVIQSNLIKSEPFLNSRWVWCIPHKMKSDWMFPWVFQHQHVGQALTLSCQSCCVFVKAKESIKNSVFSVDTDRSWHSEAMICFTQSEEDREPEMRWDLVLYQEVRGFDHVSLPCIAAVYLSSIMLKWCLHLLACLSAQDIYGLMW